MKAYSVRVDKEVLNQGPGNPNEELLAGEPYAPKAIVRKASCCFPHF